MVKSILKLFWPSGSPIILAFSHQRSLESFNGVFLHRASNKGRISTKFVVVTLVGEGTCFYGLTCPNLRERCPATLIFWDFPTEAHAIWPTSDQIRLTKWRTGVFTSSAMRPILRQWGTSMPKNFSGPFTCAQTVWKILTIFCTVIKLY